MTEKLLHERLSEYDEDDGRFICKDGFHADISHKAARRLADEIERYYIPRPRFEDGEPVQQSDIEEIGGLATCCVYTDGSWSFDPDKHEDERNLKPWENQMGRYCDRIKRPTKVLDADGVEIKPPCAAWDKSSHERYTVAKLLENGYVLVERMGYTHERKADSLTQIEPDSLEKLRDDIEKTALSLNHFIPRVNLKGFADRLTALIERDA